MSAQPSEPHPVALLSAAIGAAMHDPRVGGVASRGVVTRWVLIAEHALPDSQMSMTTLASSASGTTLRSWERAGLLTMALARLLAEQGAPPPIQE